jgi:hypothetical protein
MNKMRLFLTLVTIAIVVIPIVGVLLTNQGNLLGLFIPPEVNEIADDLMGGDDGPELEPPTMVGEPQYDEATHIFSVTFQYKNSFPSDITIKSLSGNIECVEHGFHLGNAGLNEPVSIDAGETGTMTVLGKWTNEAISHFGTEHRNEENVDVVLVDMAVAVDISGIQIQWDQNQMDQTIQVPNSAYKG